MNRKTIGLIIIIFIVSNALSFMFGAQYNSEGLVLNITNNSSDSGFDSDFTDYSEKEYTNITKKKNTTSNSTSKKNSTINNTNNITDQVK